MLDSSDSPMKQPRSVVRFRTTALLLFLVAVVLYSWNSDDAYHSYIMAKHLVEGKGLVYNPGYRATASTHPLLTLLEAFIFLFTDRPDICGLLLGLLFSGAAAWILFFRICPTTTPAIYALGLMVSSRCFLSFTTSGLENPMLFFFGALFFDLYFRNDALSKNQLFGMAILMSLLAMTRTDSVLLFAPMAVWAYLKRTKVPFPTRVAVGIAGLIPFVLWTGFSILYYGFPFPNTYYAKLYTGIPFPEYVIHGLWYHLTSWVIDPLLLLVPVLFVGSSVRSRNRTLIPLFLGLAIYEAYVISIGGDFMAGRHLTQQFFLSLCGIAFFWKSDNERDKESPMLARSGYSHGTITSAMIGLCGIGFLWNVFLAPVVNVRWATVKSAYETKRSALDERHHYLSRRGQIPLYRSITLNSAAAEALASHYTNLIRRIRSAHEKGLHGLCFEDTVLFGQVAYACANLDLYLTDVIALQDPLLARLKVDASKHWRIGHAQRAVPSGYHETIASGENKIEDPALHEYYDKILLVMTAPLFDRERLRTILDLNRGKFDRLLETYEQSPNPLSDLERAFHELNETKDSRKAHEFLDRCLLSGMTGYAQSTIHFCRGCVFEDLEDDLDNAEKEYELALSEEWGVDSVPCADRLARIKAIRGEQNEAIALWEKALKLDPESISVLWNLSIAYRETGNESRSNELRETALRLSENR